MKSPLNHHKLINLSPPRRILPRTRIQNHAVPGPRPAAAGGEHWGATFDVRPQHLRIAARGCGGLAMGVPKIDG